jgi:hypothetical protein
MEKGIYQLRLVNTAGQVLAYKTGGSYRWQCYTNLLLGKENINGVPTILK